MGTRTWTGSWPSRAVNGAPHFTLGLSASSSIIYGQFCLFMVASFVYGQFCLFMVALDVCGQFCLFVVALVVCGQFCLLIDSMMEVRWRANMETQVPFLVTGFLFWTACILRSTHSAFAEWIAEISLGRRRVLVIPCATLYKVLALETCGVG